MTTFAHLKDLQQYLGLYMVSFNTCKIMICGSNCSHYTTFCQLTQRPISRPTHTHCSLKKYLLLKNAARRRRSSNNNNEQQRKLPVFYSHATKKYPAKKEAEKLQKLEKISIHSTWSCNPPLRGGLRIAYPPHFQGILAHFCAHLGINFHLLFWVVFCAFFSTSLHVFISISDIFIGCYFVFWR